MEHMPGDEVWVIQQLKKILYYLSISKKQVRMCKQLATHPSCEFTSLPGNVMGVWEDLLKTPVYEYVSLARDVSGMWQQVRKH